MPLEPRHTLFPRAVVAHNASIVCVAPNKNGTRRCRSCAAWKRGLVTLAVTAAAARILQRVGGGERAIQSVGFIVRAGREEQRGGRLIEYAVTELDAPESIDREHLVVGVAQLPERGSLHEIETLKRAVAEVADDECIAEFAESVRSD